MRIKYKNVVLAIATISIVATPLILMTSCTTNSSQSQESELASINLQLPQEKVVLEIGQNWTSQPIIVECFDQNNNPIEADTRIVLSLGNGDDSLPSWISINQENQIHIEAESQPSTYNFDFMAQDTNSGKVKSKSKSFCVEFVNQPLLPPEAIEIQSATQLVNVFTTDTGDIYLSIDPYRHDCSDDKISKECEWTITKIQGNHSLDKSFNELFKLEKTEDGCLIKVSKDVDASYVGTYYLTIKAQSKLNVNVYDDIDMTINIIDGFNYVDSESQYTYTRKSLKDNWVLSTIPTSIVSIISARDQIYGIPVTKVDDHLCENSKISSISVIRLPKSYTEIGEYAFRNMGIMSFVSAPGLKTIDEGSFCNCAQMVWDKKSELPQLETIGKKGFYHCLHVEFSDSMTQNLTSVGSDAFTESGISSINLGPCIKSIGKNCFKDCQNLTTIKIMTDEPPILEGQLYGGSTNLQTIYVPINSIEKYKSDPSWSVYSSKFVGF